MASEENAALSAHGQIGRQSGDERSAASYLHVSSYIEDCDISKGSGTVRVMYECAAITTDGGKMVIVDAIALHRVRRDCRVLAQLR